MVPSETFWCFDTVQLFFVLLASTTYIGSVLFRASAFTGAKLASGVPAVVGRFGPSTVSIFWTDPRCPSSARAINIKTSKKTWLTSCQHHELHCLADVIFYRRLTVFQCYLSAIMHELNNSLCIWFPPLHMCILRTFRHHWSQFVIWDPVRGILKNEIQQARQKWRKNN